MTRTATSASEPCNSRRPACRIRCGERPITRHHTASPWCRSSVSPSFAQFDGCGSTFAIVQSRRHHPRRTRPYGTRSEPAPAPATTRGAFHPRSPDLVSQLHSRTSDPGLRYSSADAVDRSRRLPSPTSCARDQEHRQDIHPHLFDRPEQPSLRRLGHQTTPSAGWAVGSRARMKDISARPCSRPFPTSLTCFVTRIGSYRFQQPLTPAAPCTEHGRCRQLQDAAG